MRALAVAAAALLSAVGCGSSEPGGDARGTLAFAGGQCCGDPERIPLDIWLMNGDGSDSRRLTRNPSSEYDPSWSPDGSRLVVSSPDALYVIDADGSGRRELVRGGVHPIWSPNGEEIAFTRDVDGYAVNADGTGLRRLGGGVPGDWSPDGEEIAVTDSSQILVVGADGSGTRRLSRPEGNDYEPDWSPDGKKIAFAGVRGDAVVLVDVYVMNADGTGGERRLTKFPNKEGECFYAGIRGIDWSPDGEWIAFARPYIGCDKLGDIYVVRPDGSDLTRLTTSGFAVDPAWRPS